MEYGHGGDVYRNRNVELDFSINVNPLGMPNFVWEAAMKSIALSTRYPDSTCGALRARMSELTGIPGEMMIFGNGAAELIFRLVQTLCPKKAAIPAPSFMEYETALKACGTEVSFFYLKESESFFLNISEYLEFLKKERPDMIFLCTPANPTGAMMRKADLLKILDYCKRAGIVAVIDECFIEFLTEEKADGCIREFLAWKEGMPENGGTLFLLRAFTKTYAMAGLRIGYGFCTDPGLGERMEEIWQPWSVSIPAQEAGLAALSDERIPFLKKMRELVEKERKVLSDGLTKAGFTVFHSEANFLLFKDFKTEQESWLYEFFLEHGILIRSCKNYRELDSRFYRICVRTHEENLEFLEILKEYR